MSRRDEAVEVSRRRRRARERGLIEASPTNLVSHYGLLELDRGDPDSSTRRRSSPNSRRATHGDSRHDC